MRPVGTTKGVMPEEEYQMSEPTPEVVTTPDAPPAADEPKPVTAEDVARLQAALDKERNTRKEYERQVKEFDNQRKATMTEAERAVLEAEQRGRTSAVNEFGKRLAQTEFRAAAAARNPSFDPAAALEFVDLGRFIGEDGEPDSKAIAKAVERLVPDATPQPPSFDGGSRQAAPAGVSMTDLIRKAAGRA